MNKPFVSNEEDSNSSDNPSFDAVLNARLSRRNMLTGTAKSVIGATATGWGLTLAGCGGGANAAATTPPLLGFNAVAKSVADVLTVPSGYSAKVVFALGDPLNSLTPAYANDGNDANYESRAGDHHDGMEWFGLSSTGRPSTTSSERGLLAINHEATTDEVLTSFFLHANGGTATLPRLAAEVDKETAIHGVSVVEMQKTGGNWGYVPNSNFNFRLTCLTEVELSGIARGYAQMVTKFSPSGTRTRGTLNNCGTGKTPWGSFLTGEENWAGYFTRSSTDNTARGNDKTVTSLNRYGRSQGAASRHGWETGGSADKYQRWNNSKTGVSMDGSDDYRNELNTMGYIVEIDPYDKTRAAKKRTSLGRFAHESAVFSIPAAGKPLAVYMGDDSRNEYIYKFVSTQNWVDADADPVSRMATGDKYLDNGKLYVAKFSSDGSGQWVELNLANAAIATYAGYTFADEADIRINARLAADAVGATKMDRPEWAAVHPVTGEIYLTLTNNSNRRVDATGTQSVVDSANPRFYSDVKGTTTPTTAQGNVNGHILRVKEATTGAAATTFTWDVYLFGAQADADASKVNLSALTADQDFSSPDGLVAGSATGVMWIQTDDGAYTDVTNCMMLAAVPGQVGDGAKKTLTYTKTNGSTLSVDTYVGKAPTPGMLKRFLVGPRDCEITGLCETPDGKTIFVNIQHPGEGTRMADIADPTKYTSQWPSNAGYGVGKRPRSATIAISKADGGKVGT
jgi:uncharacterized protein